SVLTHVEPAAEDGLVAGDRVVGQVGLACIGRRHHATTCRLARPGVVTADRRPGYGDRPARVAEEAGPVLAGPAVEGVVVDPAVADRQVSVVRHAPTASVR